MSFEQPLPLSDDISLETAIAGAARRGEPMVLSVPETACLLGISRAFAYDLARRGELPTMRLGRRLVVPRAVLATFLARARGAGWVGPHPEHHRDGVDEA